MFNFSNFWNVVAFQLYVVVSALPVTCLIGILGGFINSAFQDGLDMRVMHEI